MKTRRIGFGALILLLAFTGICPAGAQPARPPAAARHSLWKVEGRTNTVYLLGSIHLLKPENYPLAAPLEAAFTNSQVVVFETDIEKMEQMDTQLGLLSKATLPDGETLEDHLSAEVYASLRQHAQDAGMPMMMLGRLKPVMAAMTLVVLELRKLGLDPEQGIDKHFFSRARKAGKEIKWLETVEFQIGLITDFSKAEGEMLVKATLEEIDNTKKLYNEMLTAWQTGDSPALEKLLNEAMRDAPVIYRRLVTDRNHRWVPQIEHFLRDNSNVIVIVGAGHLVGTEGVVELLKKKGFKVTQL